MENNNCQKCKVGIGNPSKVLQRDLKINKSQIAKFYRAIAPDVMIDCLKCNFCGHSWIPKQKIKFRLISSEELTANRNSAAEYII